MKQISSIFLFFTLLICSLQAQNQLSLATEKSNEKAWISINGVLQNDIATQSITLINIPEGPYNISIAFDNPEKEKFSTKIAIQHGENNYYITRISPKKHKFFLREVNYPLNTSLRKPFLHTNQNNGYIDHHHGNPSEGEHNHHDMRGDNHPEHGNNGNHPQYGNNGNHPQHGNEGNHPQYGYNGNHPQHGNEGNQPQGRPNEMHHPNNNPDAHAPHHKQPMGPCGSAPEQFARVKMTIENENFSSEKLALAQQLLSMDPMSADQIAEIAELLTFEKDKLEFLKFGYDFCCDIDKYGIVFNVLDFSSSKQELKKYIKARN